MLMTEKSVNSSGAASDRRTAAKFKPGDAGRDARAKDSPSHTSSAAKSEMTSSGSQSSPKKRRKVNHGKSLSRAACQQGFERRRLGWIRSVTL